MVPQTTESTRISKFEESARPVRLVQHEGVPRSSKIGSTEAISKGDIIVHFKASRKVIINTERAGVAQFIGNRNRPTLKTATMTRQVGENGL